MSSIQNVFIVSDGCGNDVWTVAIDDATTKHCQCAHKALEIQSVLSCNLNENLTVEEGSLGSRAKNWPPVLVRSLTEMDGGRNVQRHYFMGVALKAKPRHLAIGIGSNYVKRVRASKVALACRLAYEEQAPTSLTSVRFSCPIQLAFLDVVFEVQRFMLPASPCHTPAAGESEDVAEPSPSLTRRDYSGVWDETGATESEDYPSPTRSSYNKMRRTSEYDQSTHE
jgi:hypothetical protein